MRACVRACGGMGGVGGWVGGWGVEWVGGWVGEEAPICDAGRSVSIDDRTLSTVHRDIYSTTIRIP